MFDFLRPVIYIRLSPERLIARNVKTGEELAEPPEIALSGGPGARNIRAIGGMVAACRAVETVDIVNPFAHPRTLIGDFTLGTQVLKYFIKKLPAASVLTLSPRVLLHPLGHIDGGFTELEVRALREMAIGAGAGSDTQIWTGAALSDAEVLEQRFPSTGKLL